MNMNTHKLIQISITISYRYKYLHVYLLVEGEFAFGGAVLLLELRVLQQQPLRLPVLPTNYIAFLDSFPTN